MARGPRRRQGAGLMTLDRVTITGADDSIDPAALIDLSEQYPFVEWGILFSKRWQGAPRYPSNEWLSVLGNLVKLANAGLLSNTGESVAVQLSAHLCGKWMRDTLAADPSWWRTYESLTPAFQRVQLNFHAEPQTEALGPFIREMRGAAQFIFQCDGVNDQWVNVLVGGGCGVPLFDTSSGAGQLPARWPGAWPGVYCGYAGGLGPETVLEQLDAISEAVGDNRIWIDMERRVRSEDDREFDLDKVKAVLSMVDEFWPVGV